LIRSISRVITDRLTAGAGGAVGLPGSVGLAGAPGLDGIGATPSG